MTKSSRALKMAHLLDKSKPGFPWSDILRHAWYFVHFREWLAEGLVTFTYLKHDNSIRDARGTLCDLLIPQEDRPKDNNRTPYTVHHTPNFAIINYYDIDRKAWRSFDIRLFVGYVDRYPLKESKEKEPKRN